MNEYEQTGVLNIKDLSLPSDKQLNKGVAITECIQKIPCNPCVDSCPFHAITMKDINAPPIVDYDKCTACTKCVGKCPGLAIFVVKTIEDKAHIILPYELLPIPKKDNTVDVLDRNGEIVGKGLIKKIRKQGKTSIITVEIKKELSMIVRNIRI
jgi:Fe-S-cluster-containing hydrogenase component 2